MPEPPGWAGAGRRLLWATVAGLAICVIPVIYIVRAVLRGSYPTALMLFGMALSPFLIVVAMQLVHQGRTTLRAEQDSAGIVLYPDRRFAVSSMASLSVGAVAMLAIAVAIAIGNFDVPMSRGMAIGSTCVTAFGGLFGVAGLYTVWRRGGVGYVELSPDGVEIANAVHAESIEWDEIAEVADSAVEKKTRRAVVLRLQDGDEKVIDGADFYVPGGATLYWMARHYWLHPEDRNELVDARAMKRLRGGRFATA
jgi:hypothetical protein